MKRGENKKSNHAPDVTPLCNLKLHGKSTLSFSMPTKKVVGCIDFSDGIVDLFVQLFGWKMHARLGRGNGKNVGLVLKPVQSISSLSSALPRKGVACQERERIRRNAKCQAVQLLPRGIYSVRYATLMEFDEATL